MPLLLVLCLLQGSSLTPSHRGPHLRWLQDNFLPSGTHLCIMETFLSSSPLCWQEESSLAAANTLKGPKLVAGKPGGAVTIQCHYTPSSANRHQRKYWCRLQLPTRICHTIVSSNHYTHRDYQGRVTLADFPQSSLFVVRLSQLSLHDVGQYRCGIGDRNNRLFLNMNLTVSAGPSETIPTATSAAGELVTTSFGTGSPASNRWTPGTTHTLGQGIEWDRVTSTSGTSKITAPAKGRQTPATAWEEALETGSGVEGSIKATVPAPESPASKHRSVSKTTEGVQEWGTHSLVTNTPRASESGKEMTTEADRAGQETDRVRTEPDAARRTTGTMRPSAPVSEQLAQETLREATPVSKQQALGSTEGATPPTGMWTLDTMSTETASVEGSTYGDLHSTVGDRGHQATPSQAPATGPSNRSPSNAKSDPSNRSPSNAKSDPCNRSPSYAKSGPNGSSSNAKSDPCNANSGPSNRSPSNTKSDPCNRSPSNAKSDPSNRSPSNAKSDPCNRSPSYAKSGPNGSSSNAKSDPCNANSGPSNRSPSNAKSDPCNRFPSNTKSDPCNRSPSNAKSDPSNRSPSNTKSDPCNRSPSNAKSDPSNTSPSNAKSDPCNRSPSNAKSDPCNANSGPSPQATPSQNPATGPLKSPGMESSMKSAFPEVESSFRILTPVCTVLAPFLIVALVLLQRKLRGNGPSQETEKTPRVTLIQMTHFLESTLSPAHLPQEERKTLQGDSPTQAGPTAPERDPGLSGMEK
ncbi:high affinity immunoglobulin alpha and immunoglobulin mu Fc receptor [Callospermophilus lateralis]|uniref:high affinity immunoglobulin alpha and immunoglobulin mu Fc receptor n=1 Tax=Callospermophilus lateralis TaxID=76772 RepID=UPI004038E495